MAETADVIIVGGGIIGMSAAFQLARRSKLRVLVLDKGNGPGEGSTGASSAVCRFRYSYPDVVRLAKAGIGAYQHWSEFLDVKAPLARYHRTGVLWLSTGDEKWAQGEADRLKGLGIRAEAVDDAELRELSPHLNPCARAPDLETGEDHDCKGGGRHLFERDGGYVEPVDALQDLTSAARGRGVTVRFKTKVREIFVQNGRAAGVVLEEGRSLACGAVVLAAGAWCNPLLAPLGLRDRWPLEPTRIQIVHLDVPSEIGSRLPACADPLGGIYFRPQNGGQQIVLGSVLERDELEAVEDPDTFARYADDDFMREKLFALQHRLPGLTIRPPLHGYSGLYTINRSDMHPVVGSTPIGGLHVAAGCSGHGFKLAPAIGALLARGITGEFARFDPEVDPEFFAFDRTPISLATKSVLA